MAASSIERGTQIGHECCLNFRLGALLIKNEPQPNADAAIGYVSQALRQKRTKIICVVVLVGLVLILAGRGAAEASLVLILAARGAAEGGFMKCLVPFGKPCSAVLTNSVCHFLYPFTRRRLANGVIFGVGETLKHGGWLRRRQSSVRAIGDVFGPHKSKLILMCFLLEPPWWHYRSLHGR